ncbi:hypothetical protein Hanom_Chr15g01395151 [Helianthus anomalus]
MICKIEYQNYVAPENDAWRHENSNSEDETDRLSGMYEKKLRYWFVNGKRKRTPKASPTVTAPKVPPKIVVKGILEKGSHKKRPLKKSPPRLVDKPVLNQADVTQEGIDLMKVTFGQYIKQTEVAAKDQAEKVAKEARASSTKHVETESLKEKEPEGVAHTDSSDADDESTDTKSEIDKSKIGVGKVTLKKKPKKKNKGSDEEDELYIPTPQAEKKKGVLKRKANPQGIISRRVRERKGSASVPEIQSGKKC